MFIYEYKRSREVIVIINLTNKDSIIFSVFICDILSKRCKTTICNKISYLQSLFSNL